MSIKTIHHGTPNWFITFTCYKWLPLFESTSSYDLVYKWFDYMRNKQHAEVVCFVIMPNHLHAIFYLKENTDLNKLVSNGKRFMAYEIVKRLVAANDNNTLSILSNGLTAREINKGQKHRVFEESFDAKHITSKKFLYQKLNYIHQNPVRGKWSLTDDFINYEHSSASFYELNRVKHYKPLHFLDIT